MAAQQCRHGGGAGVGEGHISSVSAVALSRRGPRFAVSGGADKLLKARCCRAPALDCRAALHP